MVELRFVASSSDPEAKVLDAGPCSHESFISLERQPAPHSDFPKMNREGQSGKGYRSTRQPRHLEERGYIVPKPHKSSVGSLRLHGDPE